MRFVENVNHDGEFVKLLFGNERDIYIKKNHLGIQHVILTRLTPGRTLSSAASSWLRNSLY